MAAANLALRFLLELALLDAVPVRIVAEVVLFGAGVAALAASERTTLTIIFAAVVLLHLAQTLPLGQRSAEATGA